MATFSMPIVSASCERERVSDLVDLSIFSAWIRSISFFSASLFL
jgi:hypothetical protein